jgi:hypothetical protein
MKRHSTDARIISAFLRDTWLRDQQHATFAKLIRRSPPNHVDERGGHDGVACTDHKRNRRWQSRTRRAFDAGIDLSVTRARYGQTFANSILVL